jgi:hypothetical protein
VGISQRRTQLADQGDWQGRDQLTDHDLPVYDLHQAHFHQVVKMDRATDAASFPGSFGNSKEFRDGGGA